MANHDEDEEQQHHGAQHTARVVEEETKGKQAEEGRGRGDDEGVLLRLRWPWPWLKLHRASVVAATCFVTILALTVLLPLFVPSASSDEVWTFLG